jgi:hypothetical protein
MDGLKVCCTQTHLSEMCTASCCAGRCERMLDMIGMERLHDSQLIGRCVTSDLTEVHFRNPKSPTT